MNAQRDDKYQRQISLLLPGIESLIIQSAAELSKLKRKAKELNLVSEEVVMAERHVEGKSRDKENAFEN
jgi:hypothetical protein